MKEQIIALGNILAARFKIWQAATNPIVVLFRHHREDRLDGPSADEFA